MTASGEWTVKVSDGIIDIDSIAAVEPFFLTFDITDLLSVESSDLLPDKFALRQNYPNPFNHNTTIEYPLSRFGTVEVAVLDVLRRKIRTLVDAAQTAGYYRLQWNGLTDAGGDVASGVYLYRLRVGGYQQTRRLMLLK